MMELITLLTLSLLKLIHQQKTAYLGKVNILLTSKTESQFWHLVMPSKIDFHLKTRSMILQNWCLISKI